MDLQVLLKPTDDFGLDIADFGRKELLYERFDGFQPSIALVASKVTELRRQPWFCGRAG